VEASRANSERTLVPILGIRMRRDVIQTTNPGPNPEVIRPVVEQFFVTPNGSRSGWAGEQITFSEAINRMMF